MKVIEVRELKTKRADDHYVEMEVSTMFGRRMYVRNRYKDAHGYWVLVWSRPDGRKVERHGRLERLYDYHRAREEHDASLLEQ